MSNSSKVMAFKAMDENMKCRGFQYEVGKEYEESGAVKICSKGFHACENPFDVWNYYPVSSRYASVELSGEVEKDGDKTVCSKIAIKAELTFPEFVIKGVEYLIGLTNSVKSKEGDYAKIGSSGNSAQIGSSGDYAQIGSSGNSTQIGSSGYYAKIGSSGNSAQIGSSGDYAKIGSSGDYAQIESKGKDSVVAAIGVNSCACGEIGSWLTLAEYDAEYKPVCVKSRKIDGNRLKAGVYYKLKDKKFIEV